MRSPLLFAAEFAAVLLLLPSSGSGYGVAVHDLLPLRALALLPAPSGRAVKDDTLPGVTDADLAAFREWFWLRARGVPDTALRNAFLRRYPSESGFDERAFKEFLMMSGAARVLGVDSFAAVYRAMAPNDRRLDPHPEYRPGAGIGLLTALRVGSIYPDLDRRNADRILRDAAGRPRMTAAGDTVPFDPITLNMGRIVGQSSQAHAHYALNRQPKSDDVAVLKREPWNFAVAIGFPGPVETYAADNAQLHTDLALLALLADRPGGQALAGFFAGSATHYIADAGNPVHTVQVGPYGIFLDATIQAWVRRAGRLFGLLGQSPSRNAIGLDILSNLHNLSEKLFQAELLEAIRLREEGRLGAVRPSMRGPLEALELGNDSLARVFADTLTARTSESGSPDFARAITAILADANCRDGVAVYSATRQFANSRLRSGGITVDFDTVPDERVWRFVRVHRGAHVRSALDDFNDIHGRAIGRTTQALRVWWRHYVAQAAAPAGRRAAMIDAIIRRTLSERLRYLEAAEARRRTWIRTHGGLPNQ